KFKRNTFCTVKAGSHMHIESLQYRQFLITIISCFRDPKFQWFHQAMCTDCNCDFFLLSIVMRSSMIPALSVIWSISCSCPSLLAAQRSIENKEILPVHSETCSDPH
ncbi:hypothetical protein L9F63_003231, partial [Diploptera punctata]